MFTGMPQGSASQKADGIVPQEMDLLVRQIGGRVFRGIKRAAAVVAAEEARLA